MSDDERWKRANRLLHELFELYINQGIQPQTKQKLLTDIVEKNRYTIYVDNKFLELLETEIKKTKKHGPPFMALVYLELRWAITGEKKHLKEMEKYSRKIRKMSLKQLTALDLHKPTNIK